MSQHLVTDVVAVGVVHLLEPVEVYENQADRIPVPLAFLEQTAKCFSKRTTVQYAGERVEAGHLQHLAVARAKLLRPAYNHRRWPEECSRANQYQDKAKPPKLSAQAFRHHGDIDVDLHRPKQGSIRGIPGKIGLDIGIRTVRFFSAVLDCNVVLPGCDYLTSLLAMAVACVDLLHVQI